LGHVPAAVNLGDEPEAAVVVLAACEAEGADDLVGRCFQAKGPGPFVAAFDCGKKNVAIEVLDAVWRIGPWDARVEILDDLPLREEELRLFSVFKLERTQEEALGFEGRGHPRIRSRLAERQVL